MNGPCRKFLAAALAALAAANSYAAEPARSAVETGAPAPEPAGVWTKGEPVSLAELRGKKAVVFYFWTVDQRALDDIPRMAQTARQFADKPVAFVGVGCDSLNKVKGFFRVKELDFPILADDRAAFTRRFMREGERLPLAAVVDKEGRLVWRGNTAALPAVLAKVLDGKFDLKENIRREKFSFQVSAALRKNHYEEAVALIDTELKDHPANVELVSLKATILARALKEPKQALKAVDEALEHAPKNVAFHEIKMKLLHSVGDPAELKRFYAGLCRTFADDPMLLQRFAAVEMGRPVADQQPELYCMLMTAARNSPNFKNDRERGITELVYSQMLASCARPDLAIEAAERAVKLLADSPERKEAETMLAFYRRIAETARALGK